MFNSDDTRFGGSGVTNPDEMTSSLTPMNGLEQSLSLRLPPLGAVFLVRKKKLPVRRASAKTVSSKQKPPRSAADAK